MQFSTLFFDLDDTLYPATSGVWDAIGVRIDQFIDYKLGIAQADIPALRDRLFRTYGTTLRGLQSIYHIDAKEYLDFVHDIPLEDYIQPEPQVREIIRHNTSKKYIFTNADKNHAQRVLKVLNLDDCFDGIVDIEAITPFCKPMPEAFLAALKAADETEPARCALIDDTPKNLAAARKLGFYTIGVGRPGLENDADIIIGDLIQLQKIIE